jgi:hypothetical protein
MTTIGLTMIVKNEAGVIRRCLASVRPLLDYCLIVDTGSEDGTQQVIRDYLSEINLPGTVVDRPWRNFADNRSEGLALLREIGWIDYGFTIDADEFLVPDADFDPVMFKQSLTKALYGVVIRQNDTQFTRTLLFSNRKPIAFRGVLHEHIGRAPGLDHGTAEGFHVRTTQEGARSRNPTKYGDDAALLELALTTETDPSLRARYTYFLGQSYRSAGIFEKALEAYLRRADMGAPLEMVFLSLQRAGQIAEQLGQPPERSLSLYLRAHEVDPKRAEALCGAARASRLGGHYADAYAYAKRGLDLSPPPPRALTDTSVYAWRMLDEFQIAAYWAAHFEESLDAATRLLEEQRFPDTERDRIAANALFAIEAVEKQA